MPNINPKTSLNKNLGNKFPLSALAEVLVDDKRSLLMLVKNLVKEEMLLVIKSVNFLINFVIMYF